MLDNLSRHFYNIIVLPDICHSTELEVVLNQGSPDQTVTCMQTHSQGGGGGGGFLNPPFFWKQKTLLINVNNVEKKSKLDLHYLSGSD